jgi:hypothetical protein
MLADIKALVRLRVLAVIPGIYLNPLGSGFAYKHPNQSTLRVFRRSQRVIC